MGIIDTPPAAVAQYVVPVDKTLALVVLILNILAPGWGTMITACLGPEFNAKVLVIGLVQLVLTCIIVGWIWSILHGIWVYKKSS